jgi:hypothetical protein
MSVIEPKVVYKLKFYEKERELFPTEFNLKISQHDVIKIGRKLSRHFKFTEPDFYFRGSVDSGTAMLSSTPRLIRLGMDPSWGMFLHELSHVYNKEKYNNSHHNKRLMKTLKRFILYCQKKDFWG